MTQPLAGAKSVGTENELDIRGFVSRVMAGAKLDCGDCPGGVRAVSACLHLPLQNKSGAPRRSNRPTVNMLGGYYSQQQFLRNLDIKANLATPDQASVMDESYKEFVMQLASWDTRRDFWSQTDYYKQRMVGNSKADAALLDDLINNIQFMPGDVLP